MKNISELAGHLRTITNSPRTAGRRSEGLADPMMEHRVTDKMIEHWGATFKGYPNFSQKMYPQVFAEAIDRLVADTSLSDECRFSASVAATLKSNHPDMTDGQAEAVIALMYRCFRDHFIGRAGSAGEKVGMPKVAASLVLSALDFLEEAQENGRTIIAYRNRHADFLNALAQIGEEIYGKRQYHDEFYTHLGRRLSQVVVGEGLGGERAVFSVERKTYEAVELAVAEQLVYFIGCGTEGPVKIGIAAKPHERLGTLQTGHHEKLHLLAVTTGGREAELAYHEKFSAHHARGEWFARHPSILAEIARLQETPRHD